MLHQVCNPAGFASRNIDGKRDRSREVEEHARWCGDHSRHGRKHRVSTPFVLRRAVDVSGVSGTGDVAEGVEWSDGTVALRWRGKWATTVVWDYGLDALLAVHGHAGSTVVRWLDVDRPI